MAKIRFDRLSDFLNGMIDDIIVDVTISLYNGITSDTRVDTGRMRANWLLNSDYPIREPVDTVTATMATAEEVTPGRVMFITNNVTYAPYWEERDAMIDRNIVRLEELVSASVRKHG